MANLQIVPAGKNVVPQFVEMKVPLYSYGCEKKVKKALSQLRGIHSVEVDFQQQKVTVWGICNREDVLSTIRKKRREARFWDQQQEDEAAEIKCSVEPEEEAGKIAEKARRVVALCRFKFRKSWKKLLPLVLY